MQHKIYVLAIKKDDQCPYYNYAPVCNIYMGCVTELKELHNCIAV